MSGVGTGVLALLEVGRAREKAQTLFYRTLAARAQAAGDEAVTERLNELHADEQHHLSRLTARVLELGAAPADLRETATPPSSWPDWEGAVRAREAEEVAWYQKALSADLDEETRAVVEEILESELQHRSRLGGKWMSA